MKMGISVSLTKWFLIVMIVRMTNVFSLHTTNLMCQKMEWLISCVTSDFSY